MRVIYVCSACSKNKLEELFNYSNLLIPYQSQKYHDLLINGIEKNNVDITVISALPINRIVTKKLLFKKQEEKVGNIEYFYLPFVNLPGLRQVSLFLATLFYSVILCKKNADSVFISDILGITISSGIIIVSKLLRKISVGIVTDIPGFLSINKDKKISLTNKVNRFILDRFDSYLFLTKQMNDLINKKDKPFVVIEGHVDINMANIDNTLEGKYGKKVCIYSGAIERIYGMEKLVKAFLNANIENSEMHFYGNGDYVGELSEICKTNKSIKYFGVKPNEHVIKEQIKATLLINPRPSDEEFTKYSFPSKNMEYMVSGTPILTTNLPGMPEEYKRYVYLIEDETEEGLTNMLKVVISKTREELYQKGQEAKQFVLENKNNVVQADKILGIIRRII